MVQRRRTTISISPEMSEELARLKKLYKVSSVENAIKHLQKLAEKYIQYRRSEDYNEVGGIENPNKFMEVLETVRSDQKGLIWEELKKLRKDINRLRHFKMQVVDDTD